MSAVQDCAQALRSIRKNPGFTAVAVLTLGLGIGANTTIFSVVNGVLLEPLRYPEPDRIVALATTFSDTGRPHPRLTGGELLDLQQNHTAFEALSTYGGGEIGMQLADRAEFTGIYFVNDEFFNVFGVQPKLGRVFTDQEAESTAVASESFAKRNFGSAADAIGKKFNVENRSYTIVGVMDDSFRFPRPAGVWLATKKKPENLNRTAYNYQAVARLKKGLSLQQAQEQLDVLNASMAAANPDTNKNKRLTIVAMKEQLVGPVRTMLYFLLGAVSLVLLIACANVANLLLARSTSRAREFAVRAALGAGTSQIARQLAIENGILALMGGATGLVMVAFGLDALVRLAPSLPRLADVQMNQPVLWFTLAACMAASFLFGFAPVYQACKIDLYDALKQGGSRGLLGSGSQKIRKSLVVAEIALSVMLAIGGGLLFRSLLALNSSDLGYRTQDILVMYSHVPAHGLKSVIAATHEFESLFGKLATVPGVRSVAGAMGLPTGRYSSNGGYIIEGVHSVPPPPSLKMPQAGFRLASPGYFSTLGIPLRQGREFTERDQYDAPFVAIISDSLAKQSFPNENPIGRRIMCGLDSPKWMTVVGVVGDVRQNSPASSPSPELYMPFQQHPYRANELQVVIRTSVPPMSLAGTIQAQMKQWSPSTAVKFTTLESMVSESIATPRFRTVLAGMFAILALLLAMAGIYGVMNYLVTQRTSEFGLRMALGASVSDVLRLTLSQGAALAAIGLVLGIAGAAALSRVLDTMLYGLKPTDMSTYAIVSALVFGITMIAAAVPSLRAGRVDPITALRDE